MAVRGRQRCTRCRRSLPTTAFYVERHRDRPTRFSTRCRECIRAAYYEQGRSCTLCGEQTRSRDAIYCDACRPAQVSGHKRDLYADRFGRGRYWTRERIIAAMQKWNEVHGRPPSARAWKKRGRGTKAIGRQYRRWPATQNVEVVFGSWSAGLEAAGLESNRPGRSYQDEPRCRNGHAWTDFYVGANGLKTCRVCHRESNRRSYRRRMIRRAA